MDKMQTEQVLLRSEQDKLRSDQITQRNQQDQFRTDQITQQEEQDQLRSDQATQRSDLATLQNTIMENASKVTHNLMSINDRLSREMDKMRTENIKLNEVIVITKSETDTLTSKLTDINEMYNKMKDVLCPYRMDVGLKQNGWIEHGNYMYKAIDENMSWSDAMDKCKSESNGKGFLAEIQNMNEYNFVTGLFQNDREFWLGGCDIGQEGWWKWCGSGNSMTFQNWRNNEPNNSGGNEHCLQNNNKWNDGNCRDKMASVCEIVNPNSGKPNIFDADVSVLD